MPQHTRHDAGVGAKVTQQDQCPDRRYSVCLAVMAPGLLANGARPYAQGTPAALVGAACSSN